jgi:hypothetical protein
MKKAVAHKKPAAQKIAGEYLRFWGGDLLPLPLYYFK